MIKNKLLVFILIMAGIGCSSHQKKDVDLLLTNATIINIQSGQLEQDKLIAIAGDSIIAIDESNHSDNYEASKTVDEGGNFVMPGLWDMHVHFRGGDSLIAENRNLLPLFLAYGITTVRECGGDMTPAVMHWRKEIKQGALDGPRIFTSGPKLDGANPAWAGSIPVTNQQQINHALDSLQEIGSDFVKIYDGSITKEMYYGIIKEAHKRGMLVTGHMPLTANILQAAKDGLDAEEHIYYVLKSCSPKADSLTKRYKGYGMMDALVDTYDPKLADKVFKTLADSNFFITPTLNVGNILAKVLVTDHSQDSLLRYIGPGIQKTYQRRVRSAKRGGEAYTSRSEKLQAQFRRMVVPMHKAGINLVAGSDSGPYNSYDYPGQSLHQELHLLVQSGLSPLQALQTATINGPRFFGLGDSYGAIAPGKKADIVILAKNPLENIDHINSINSVVAHGKVYTSKQLHRMMTSLY